jgi:hypothetical protein
MCGEHNRVLIVIARACTFHELEKTVKKATDLGENLNFVSISLLRKTVHLETFLAGVGFKPLW